MLRRLSAVVWLSPTFCFDAFWSRLYVAVSSSAYASLDDGIAHYYSRTGVSYVLTTYCCAASSERNSSYQLCCINGNGDCNTNSTMMQQVQQQYVAENTTVAADITSTICHGLARAAPAVGGVLLYVLMDNSVITALYRHVQDRSGNSTGTATLR